MILKDMSYLLIFFNACVVALMAIYVYENEKEMAVNSGRHDITAIAAMFVVALMIMYVYENERTMRQIAAKSDQTGTAVVFSAVLSHNIVNTPSGHIIVFDKTSVNVGNGYSTQTGIFRAPVAGVYQFSLTIGASVAHTHANIIHNRNVIGHLFADHLHDRLYGRATLTLAAYLNIGDEVWTVDPDGQINQVIIGSHDGMPVSIFTGHLIGSN